MEHTQIVNSSELEKYASTRESEAVIPELVWMLVKESAPDLTVCRIPYGDAINQPGYDGLVETENGFRQFVPRKKSYWEIGTGNKPQDKAAKDFRKRSGQMRPEELEEATYVIATPHGWNEPSQRRWVSRRKESGWKAIKILDGVQFADWLREFPAIGRWLRTKTGLARSISGFTTPAEHWENLQAFVHTGDPPLPAKLFLAGRDQACSELGKLFRGEVDQLVLATESQQDTEDFVAAFLASLDAEVGRSFSNRCLFVENEDAWLSLTAPRPRHVLLASQQLDLDLSGERLHSEAKKKGHAVIFSLPGSMASGSGNAIPIRSPSASAIETILCEVGYTHERASELAGAGAMSLATLKRHLRGLGVLPPYATWDEAQALALAGLLGRWVGENPSDRTAVETLVGKSYGEWIEIIRPETLRPDTPLSQRNENWRMVSRGEAWSALGPRLCNEDLNRFHKTAVRVLGERDPQFDLTPEERFTASIHGKVLQHSTSLRRGIAETLALLGSRSRALSSCSEGKAEAIAALTIRALLTDADWIVWASLNDRLPMLAEAAPDDFMNAVEAALSSPTESPFVKVFAQEGPGIMGRNYMTGLLWALETLAWHPDYLVRAAMLLGELAAIDAGGQWGNRPGNSLANIFLPWHPQTCATTETRKSAVRSLLCEQPEVGWKLLMALLPNSHGVTSGTRRPSWREFILAGWSGAVAEGEYWEQSIGYAELAVETAAMNVSKLAELIDHLPDLPEPAWSRVLEHLGSDRVLALPESSRLPLWEAIVDLVATHRKFADAQWAMASKAIEKIEAAAAKIAPKSPDLVYRRLFSDREHDLFEEKGNYEEQRRHLDLRRQAAMREILGAIGMTGVIHFALQVASASKAGHALAYVALESDDRTLLPAYLCTDEKALSAFISGFIWARFLMKRWPWVNGVIDPAWTIEQKAILLSLLPFEKETWRRAEELLDDAASMYWRKANVNPWWASPEDLPEAVERLLSHGRPWAAVTSLDRLVHERHTFSTDLAVRALRDSLTVKKQPDALDHHAVLELIKWLQENPNSDTDSLFQVEVAYLPLLDHQFGGTPKTLEFRLASDPAFFCDVISLVFRSDREKDGDRQPTELDRSAARNVYQLLHAWKTVPGVGRDGSFDGDAFVKWLSAAKQRTTDSGHVNVAMSQIGHVLPYSPPDTDGLWIHHSVAEALNAKDATEMRSGFTAELFNMRGVYGFTSGREEREIAVRYNDMANALERAGYPRFATAVRGLAKEYEREANREAQRDPFDDL